MSRIWQARRIRPWKVETFKLSTDPSFESKLRDVVGLYVNPPAAAAVFCFDEITQVQALDRTRPSLPMVPGRAGTMTHDYKRNGTLDLFAALNVGSGEVLHDTRRSHTGRDVLAFFRWIDMHVDPDLELHVILDNLSAHKSQPVRDWLAHKKRRRWHLHFTPTSSSWLNLVECWFSVLSRKALTNTSFTSVAELETRIDCWVSHWNDNPEPFVWTKPADEIRQSRPRTSHPRPDHQIRDTPLARIARGGGLRVREKPS
jgi:transposase